LITGLIEVQKIGWETKPEKINTLAEGGHGGGDEVMAKSLVETLLHGAPPLASVQEGMKSAIVAFGIDQAADENRVINLNEMWHQAGIRPMGAPVQA
jgi:hypothetical protein